MQIVFDDGHERRELDVRLNDPAATVADLIAALAPASARDRRLLIDDHVAPPELELVESGLHEGAQVRIADRRTSTAGRDASLTLDVIGGLDGGRRLALRPGRSVVGRDATSDLVLASDTLSRQHAEISVDDAGRVEVRDLDSLNGTWIDGRAITSPSAVASGEVVQFGTLQTAVRSPVVEDRPAALDPLRQVRAAGTIPFNRPPRPAPPRPHKTISPPEPPRDRGTGAAFNVVALVAPLVLAGALYAATRQLAFIAVTLLSPVMVLGNWIQGKVQGRRGTRRERERFTAALAAFRSELETAAAEEAHRREDALPDPAEVVRRAVLPSTRFWERRRHHDDLLALRAGIRDVPWSPPMDGPDKTMPAEVDAVVRDASMLRRSTAVDLADGGVVGIVGDRPAALALARSLVCQAAVHHGPADLPVAVLAGADGRADWDWAKWLPHVRDPGAGDRHLSDSSERSNQMADTWLAATQQRQQRGGSETDRDAPTLLVVVDDESLTEGRRAPVRSVLRTAAGPVAGIVVASTVDRLPAVCTTVVEVRRPSGEASLHVPQRGHHVDQLLVAGMADETARTCARALARFEDPELAIAGAGLLDRVRLLPLLELDPPEAAAVLARWKSAGVDPPPSTPIGATDDGVLALDLRLDGPHGLVGGTTGSGKSELLRTILVGLAANVDPDHLTFVLIDFKGGSAFDECARLPHTVGMVTDLDEHLAERALRCLEAELKHRERVPREAGATDLTGYLRGGHAAEPLPKLLVVVDEFATLKAELPEFIDALVGVAQRGRSLGVHLLLATQRPSGAVSDNIRANANLRIALRVQDDADSTDIIAARMPPGCRAPPQAAPTSGSVRVRWSRSRPRCPPRHVSPVRSSHPSTWRRSRSVRCRDTATGSQPHPRPTTRAHRRTSASWSRPSARRTSAPASRRHGGRGPSRCPTSSSWTTWWPRPRRCRTSGT
jgi:DNA segregation ATPase FtsK/SpoIIIE, S-DNA-T family